MTHGDEIGAALESSFASLVGGPNLGSGEYGLVEAIPGVWVGRNWLGAPVVLIEAELEGTTLNVDLGQVRFRSFVRARQVDHSIVNDRRGALLVCQTLDEDSLWFFWRVCGLIVSSLPHQYSSADIRSIVWGLVDLLQAVGKPRDTSDVGLFGELLFILGCSNMTQAVEAWHANDDDVWDFEFPTLRLDVKTTMSKSRLHSVSFEQANALPTVMVRSVFCSLRLRRVAGGVRLGELVDLVIAGVRGNQELVTKVLLNTNVVRTQRDVAVDLQESLASARLVDVLEVPGIRGDVPVGVDLLRFRSDFDLVAEGTLVDRCRWADYGI